MKLIEIFNQLTYGELSQISMGDEPLGVLSEKNYPRIVPHINLGLLALHKRFCLKENSLVLELQPDQVLYPIKLEYAAMSEDSDQNVRTIIDTEEAPFLDDLLKIERVYSDEGFEFELNNRADPFSLMTPSYNVLRVPLNMVADGVETPAPYFTENLTIHYRAKHFEITEDTGLDDPEFTEIDLPYSHLEALLLFVASRIHNPIGMDNQFHTGNNYAAKYEAECQRLEMVNFSVDQGSQSTRLYRNGWV